MADDALTILIVEDDEDARDSLCDILELDGHTVTGVGTLHDALAYRGWEQLDVILLDRKLSDGRAEEILPELRRTAPHVDVIVITGYTDLEGTITALRHGVADYVIKPVSPDVLRNGLQRTARRRQTERRLREQREFAEKIFQTAEAIVLVLDLEGKIIRFNPCLEHLTGYRCQDCIGQCWLDIFVPEGERDKARQCFEQGTKSGELRGVVYPILTREGRRCDVRWSNTTLKNDADQVTAVLCIGLDITDFLHTQQQLLQSERLAAIGETVAGLAHESRNALQRIRSGIEVLEQTCGDNPEVLKDLRRIDKAAEDLRALLDEVRSYAAPIVLERQSIDLPRVWRHAWEQLKQTARDRQLRLDEHVNGELRPVSADPRKLESVFRNLFQNSLESCSGPVHVALICFQSPQGTRIEVTDHGPGLDSHQASEVFKAFYTTKATGTGLGLAICRRIIEAHGGTIQALATHRTDSELSTSRQDAPWTGARFVIWLPTRPER